MKQIVYDCDNTLGVAGCDVDDGLALCYLLGCKEAKVHGITATYGNNNVDVVFETTKHMLAELGFAEIRVVKGGAAAGDYDNEAARYLVEMARLYKGELSILATGSLTNLGGAYELDPHFFENVKEIVLMGGITAPLIFEKKEMKELNMSCDPLAAYTVMTKGQKVSVVTANNCLKVIFTKQEYNLELSDDGNRMARYIKDKTDYWFGYNETDYGIGGFYNWDVTAAVYLMHPELFIDCRVTLLLSEPDLRTGYLRESGDGNCCCNLPEIGQGEVFKRNIYDAWLRVFDSI